MSRTVRRDLEELLDERFGICVTGDEGQLDELGPMGEPAVGDRGILADSHVGARVIPRPALTDPPTPCWPSEDHQAASTPRGITRESA